MSLRLHVALLTTLHLCLLSPAGQALSLTPATRLTLSGPSKVTALTGRSQGGPALCLGERVLLLDTELKLERSLPLGGPCQALAVNPAGDLIATLRGGNVAEVAVWHLPEAQRVLSLPTSKAPTQLAFRSDTELLLAGPAGLESLTLPAGSRTVLSSTPLPRLFMAPNGQRAVMAGALGAQRRLELVNLNTLKAVSAVPCANDCQAGNVVFSADGLTATVYAERTLYALRDGYPGTTVARDTDNASGLPLPDGTVLTLNAGQLEIRDLLTGHRERSLTYPGVQPYPAQLSANQRVLAFNDQGELLEANAAFTEVKHLPLPAQTAGGGFDNLTGQALAWLANGQAFSGNRAMKGTYWAMQTMNKTTWALVSDGTGGLSLNVLNGAALKRYPSQASHTHLSVNHWGNFAATWDADTLRVVSQASGKVSATLTLPGTLLDGAQVSLSPDGTRAYVFPRNAAPFVVTLSNGKRFPLPIPPGFTPTGVQISGQGVLAYADSKGQLSLFRPGEKKPYLTTPGHAQDARFSPDSLYLALPTSDEQGSRISILNVKTGKTEARTPPLADQPSFLAWSTERKHLTVGAGLLDALNSLTVFDVK